MTGAEKVPVCAARRTNGRLDCGHDAAPVPEKLDVKKPWNVGDRGALGMCRVSSEQPGIPAKATHHLFTRRVGSPGYGGGSSQGQKGAALAV